MTKKRILLVTNYYEPERGAAANRIQAMAEGFAAYGYEVHVICPLPNYPTGTVFTEFKGSLYRKTQDDNITIHRLWLWPSNSGNKLIRLVSMLSFSVSLSIFFLLKKLPKLVLVQYSPVLVGFTAVLYSWLFRKKIVLNVSDLWPLAGFEMGLLKRDFYYSLLEKMEFFCYRKSHLILGQSKEILKHVLHSSPKKSVYLYRNVPGFLPPNLSRADDTKEKIKIVYAGLLGVAQGLHSICRTIELPSHIEMHIYGAGPEASEVADLNKNGIFFHGEVSREVLHDTLLKYDIAFVPLAQRIFGSVPSKIFEYTRLGLPVLYQAGGEGGDIIELYKLGWRLPVNNPKALQDFIKNLDSTTLKEFPKNAVQESAITNFDFKIQFRDMLESIQNV